jgi:hypothetical protein
MQSNPASPTAELALERQQNSKLTIGIDLDGTCFDYIAGFVEHVRDETGQTLDLTTHHLGLSFDDFAKLHDGMIANDGMLRMLPYAGVVSTLNDWNDRGYRLVYITARDSFTNNPKLQARIWDQTLQLIDKHGLPQPRSVMFSVRTGGKLAACQRAGARVMIDDRLDEIQAVNGKPLTGALSGTIMGVLITRPWNAGWFYRPRIMQLSDLNQSFANLSQELPADETLPAGLPSGIR